MNWLITGGTGSFGKAFTRYLLDKPGTERIVIYSRDELKQAEMRASFDDARLRFFVGDVRDQPRLELALHGVDQVVHAAAMKRVEVCEANPGEAIATNLHGTSNVLHACIAAGVVKAVFLSTDKACSPNTLYGTTKLAAEKLWVRGNVYSAGRGTSFVATRYGNVIGSRGSVIPLWLKQARSSLPLTVTDPDMTRFFMTMAEAVGLVAHAFSGRRGDVLIPKIMSTDMRALAAAVRRYVGHPVGMQVIGMRPGEKMHEALLTSEESRTTVDCGDIYRLYTEQTWTDEPAVEGAPVEHGFEYSSLTATRFTEEELMRIVEEADK